MLNTEYSSELSSDDFGTPEKEAKPPGGGLTGSYLNLGCGRRYHPDWINIDVAPYGPGVIKHDLSRGIPLPDASCAVVYHSAVLEHIRRAEVLGFLGECYRVLQPGGILRVAVPDLGKICQLYLAKLQAAFDGNASAARDYDWLILEMLDQTVREQSGGDMLAYLQLEPMPNEDFVFSRIGEEGRVLVAELKRLRNEMQARHTSRPRMAPKLSGLRERIRRKLLSLLLGAEDQRALTVGRFRLAGEVHQWMYDRFSLRRLLLTAGFHDPVQQDAVTSQIQGWASFNLDTLADGTVVKPDLFYMEATKPEVPVHG